MTSKEKQKKENTFGPHGNLNNSGVSGAPAKLIVVTHNMPYLDYCKFLNTWVEPGMHCHLFFAYFQLQLISWTSCEGHYDPHKKVLLDRPSLSFKYSPEVTTWLSLERIHSINTLVAQDGLGIFIRNNAQTFNQDSLTISANLDKTNKLDYATHLIFARQQMFAILRLLQEIKESQ